jgi:hypothetical protein
MMNKRGNLDGLEIRNGRLINNAPDGMTGIQKAAMMKKARRVEEKTMIMENAMYRAEMRADMMENMKGKSCCD